MEVVEDTACIHAQDQCFHPVPVSPAPRVQPPYPAEGLLPQLLDDEVTSSCTAIATLGVHKAEQGFTGHLLGHHRDSAVERSKEKMSGRDLWTRYSQSLSV